MRPLSPGISHQDLYFMLKIHLSLIWQGPWM